MGVGQARRSRHGEGEVEGGWALLLSRGGRTAGRQGWVLVIEEETEALMGKEGCWPLSGGVGKGSRAQAF